jgi:hypothetical protein
MRDVIAHSFEKAKNIRDVTAQARSNVINGFGLHEFRERTDEITELVHLSAKRGEANGF